MVYSPLILIFLPIITALIVYLFKNKHINYLALFSQAILSIVTVLYFIEFQSDFSKTMIKYGLEAEPIKYYLLYAVNISTIIIMLKLSVIFFKEPHVTFYMKRILQLFVLIGTALAIIILGVFYSPLTAVLFDIDLSGFTVNSLNAGFDYFVSVGVACLIYFGVVYKEGAFFKRLRKYRLSFETANVIFIGCLALLASMFVLL